MQVRVMEFNYEGINAGEIETQMASFMEHQDVVNVNITQWEEQLLVFFFYEE